MQFKGKFPSTFKKLENGQFTVKLKIHKDNIGNSEELYLATNIYPGFEREEVNEDEETTIRQTEHSISEVISYFPLLTLLILIIGNRNDIYFTI